ncbi:MAG: hypothetical protein PHN56_06430 [Candidatus Nanoarchaeia archaeon]|nr:hypothetical protein [Candidatus Nanoarchaeia archaeon]
MKSQFFSIEALLNITLFTTIFLMVLFIINSKSKEFTESTVEDYLMVNSNNVINLLTLTSGYPRTWNSTNYSDLGICDSPKIINPKKLSNFVTLLNNNYSKVLESFSIEAYKLYFSLEYLNGTKIIEYKPFGDVKNVLISKRKVLYNNYPAILKVGVIN